FSPALTAFRIPAAKRSRFAPEGFSDQPTSTSFVSASQYTLRRPAGSSFAFEGGEWNHVALQPGGSVTTSISTACLYSNPSCSRGWIRPVPPPFSPLPVHLPTCHTAASVCNSLRAGRTGARVRAQTRNRERVGQ